MKQYVILSAMLLAVPLVGCGGNNTSALIVTTEQKEEGTVTGSGSYAWGSDVTIKATANTDYEFEGWYVDGEKVASIAEYTLQMPQKNVTYLARFVAKSYLLEIASADSAEGSVWGDFGLYPWGTRVTIVATPRPGYSFQGWYFNDEIIGEATSTYFFDMPKENIKLVAKFSETVKHNLNVTILPEAGAGTVTGQGVYEAGQRVTLKATVDSKYEFKGWYLNKELVSSELSIQVIMGDSDIVYEASYVHKKYTIVFQYPEHEVKSVTINAEQPLTWGKQYRLTVVPETGYRLLYVWLNDELIEHDFRGANFVMPAQNSKIRLFLEGRPS